MTQGFTIAGATTSLDAVLGSTLYAKLHTGPPFDGTLNASVFTTRQAVTFGAPDSNGAYNLDAPFSFTPIAAIEGLWGVSLWTSLTVGTCLMVREFTSMKTVFVADTLTVVSMPVVPTVVGL